MMAKRSLRNHLAHELMDGLDVTWEHLRWTLDQAQLVLDFVAAHPVELAEWIAADLARWD